MSNFITNGELRIEAERLCDENERLKAENAELVRVLHELEQEAVHAYRCLQHDCEQVLESEQHFFKKWWSSDCENAKLRKELKDVLSLLRLGARSGEGISREWCRERLDYYSDRMRELGIEVK